MSRTRWYRGTTDLVATRYEAAVNTARELARRRGVAAWYRCDHMHFVCLARHRAAPHEPAAFSHV
jgi:hypothetical protein